MKVNLNKKVKIVSKKKIDGYLGMNRPAAKKIKDYKGIVPPKGTEYVSDAVKKKDRVRIGRHEMIEDDLITKKGMGYKLAHKISNKLEKQSSSNIRKKLKSK